MTVFTRELLKNFRREFGGLWLAHARGARPPGPPPFVALAQGFVTEAEALAARLDAADRLVASLAGQPVQNALAAATAFDLEGLSMPAQALEARARKLRAALGQVPAPAAARPAPPPSTAARPAQDLKGWLQRWTGGPGVEATPAARPAADPVLDRARLAFDAARQLARDVLAYVSPRLNILQVALSVTGLPGPRKSVDAIRSGLGSASVLAEVPEAQRAFLPPIVLLYCSDGKAVQRVQVALVQWTQAKGLDGEARLLSGALSGAPPEQARTLLQQFNSGQYRAAIYPLSHLHVSFKGLAGIDQLFPDPSTFDERRE